MATLVLSAAGAALGGGLGGSFFGLSTLVAGKALGATVGSLIDQRLLGAGSAPVETGRVDRLRVMGSGEGSPIPRCFGRMRVPCQVIWSSRFLESVNARRAGGKGSGGAQQVREYSYSVSLALALCEGEVMRVGRIWADGQPLAQSGLTWRLYDGSEDQLPDPLIAAIEGADNAPTYRGTAYAVIEDLDLSAYGNRIPQFNFEVFRRPTTTAGVPRPAALDIRGIALVPGTGEYSLATEPVMLEKARGETSFANVNNDRGLPDLVVSLDQAEAELPALEAVSLVVSWFADDLRIDRCALYPAVEQRAVDGAPMPWSVAGISRSSAREVSISEGRPLFGGTPSDTSVVQAIRHMTGAGRAVLFYPFILLDILAGNARDNPWVPGTEQPPVPWRGRMTLSKAPGVPGTPDKSPAAAAEVAQFFGTAAISDFSLKQDRVVYSGPDEWSYRRFILHYAHLCALAGSVDAFCIGSEMRALTQIRDGGASYPAVQALCALAADVRSVLGPDVKISYAADWSEYFGHHTVDGTGDVLFHLDDLWAHPAIDFIGVDNYMPLSDWRDGPDHLDAGAGSIYDLGYLTSNVAGGEGYSWYYPDQAARDSQARLAIEDGAHGEHWIFRYKDLRGWWSHPHFNRLAGVKAATSTAWQPESKPIWFTELGCPAVDKGTNQPNVFHDPKSSESLLPHHSRGMRDDFIQQRYLQAMYAYWSAADNNPVSSQYAGRMVELARSFVWAWDARPWPDFPARSETWSDGSNYELGHWINGRIAATALAEVVAEICGRSRTPDVDVSKVHGLVTGYVISGTETARQSLQPLLLAYALDSFCAERKITFRPRRSGVPAVLSPDRFVVRGREAAVQRTRASSVDLAERVSLGFVRSDLEYQAGVVDASAPDQSEPSVSEASVPLVLSVGQARSIAERWLNEAQVAREAMEVVLPLSELRLMPGDVAAIESEAGSAPWRIDGLTDVGAREVRLGRVDPALYGVRAGYEPPMRPRMIIQPGSAYLQFLDLPMLTGEEVPHAPHAAALARPWAGPIALYMSAEDHGYRLNSLLRRPAVLGRLLDPLPEGVPGVISRSSVRIRVDWGELTSRQELDVLNGANAAAVRHPDAEDWEVIQFLKADLLEPRTYRLTGLLRGQAGTDCAIPESWPGGTDFVLLDEAVSQIDLPVSARGLERHFRYGPAARTLNDSSFGHKVATFAGVGLRPYRPVHLSTQRLAGGSIRFMWTRRSRVDGDTWESGDIPVGEARLLFEIRILDGTLTRTELTSGNEYVYAADQQSAHREVGLFRVAQVSERFGPGPFASLLF